MPKMGQCIIAVPLPLCANDPPFQWYIALKLRRSVNSCMSSFPSQLRSAKRQRPPICALPQMQNMSRVDSVNCITPAGTISCKINYFLQDCEDGSSVETWHYAMHATNDLVPCLCVCECVCVCVVCVVCVVCGCVFVWLSLCVVVCLCLWMLFLFVFVGFLFEGSAK